MSDSKIYRDGNKLIKIYLSDPYEYVAQAYKKQKFAYDAGLPVPAVFGLKRINRTQTALEMEHIEGNPLILRYEGKADEIQAMRIMAKLQCQMHTIDASNSDLPCLITDYVNEIKKTPYLSGQIKEALLALIKQLDNEKSSLCHGDMHPGNIMVNDKGNWIVDLESIAKGPPAADACMTYFYAKRWAADNQNQSDELYLHIFCEESGIQSDEVLAWLPVIAGVQININDENDRTFISNFLEKWYRSTSE